jgi:Tfp pilus assembly protein FimT
MPKKLRKEAGFTLVEMLCIISILGLFCSIAVPDITALISKATYTQLRFDITSQLKEAQLLAMSKEIEVLVRFTNDDITTIENKKITKQIQLPEDIQINSNYKNNEVVFQETGQVRGGTIILKQYNKEKMKVVIQVASGTTKIQFDV